MAERCRDFRERIESGSRREDWIYFSAISSHPFLTAVENVMLAQYFHSMTDEKEANDALTRVGLGDRAHHLPSQLSAASSSGFVLHGL